MIAKNSSILQLPEHEAVNTEKEDPVIKELKSGTVTQDHNTFGKKFEMEQDKT